MAVTALTISAQYTRNGEVIDQSVLGLSDPLGFSVTATGTDLAMNLVAACLFKAANGDVIASGDVALSTNGAKTSAVGLADWQRLNLKHLRTSHNCGDSVLNASCGGQSASLAIEVVLASAWGLKQSYFPGIPDVVHDRKQNLDVTIMNDATIYQEVQAAISAFQESTKLILLKKIIATDGYADQTYDILQSGQIAYYRIARNFLTVWLPYAPILGTPSVKQMAGSVTVWEIPDEWRSKSLDRHNAIIKHVPYGVSSGLASFSLALNLRGVPMLAYAGGHVGTARYMPAGFHYLYTAGWDELHDPLPGELVRYITRNAAMSLADRWWIGLTQGLASMSLSADGLSRSTSRSDPGFTQAKMQWAELNKQDWERHVVPRMPLQVLPV